MPKKLETVKTHIELASNRANTLQVDQASFNASFDTLFA